MLMCLRICSVNGGNRFHFSTLCYVELEKLTDGSWRRDGTSEHNLEGKRLQVRVARRFVFTQQKQTGYCKLSPGYPAPSRDSECVSLV